MIRRLVIVVLVALFALSDVAPSFLVTDVVAQEQQPKKRRTLMDLLFGGGETYGYRFPCDIDAVVRKPLAEVFPQLAQIPFDYCWGGTLGITMSRMPYVRRHAGNVLSASGFSGQGVALATLAGRILADAVAGQAQKFDLLASLPATAFPGGPRLRAPLLVLAMTWYALRDRLG